LVSHAGQPRLPTGEDKPALERAPLRAIRRGRLPGCTSGLWIVTDSALRGGRIAPGRVGATRSLEQADDDDDGPRARARRPRRAPHRPLGRTRHADLPDGPRAAA